MGDYACNSPERQPLPGPAHDGFRLGPRHVQTPEKHLNTDPESTPEHAIGKRLERADGESTRGRRSCRKLLTALELAPLDQPVARAASPAPTCSLLRQSEPESTSRTSIIAALEGHRSDQLEGSSPRRGAPSVQTSPTAPTRQPQEAMRRNPNTIIRLDMGRTVRRQNLQERHLRLMQAEMAVA